MKARGFLEGLGPERRAKGKGRTFRVILFEGLEPQECAVCVLLGFGGVGLPKP